MNRRKFLVLVVIFILGCGLESVFDCTLEEIFDCTSDSKSPLTPVPTPTPAPNEGMLIPAGKWFQRDGKFVYLSGLGDPERRAFLPNRDRITRNQINFGGNVYPWYATMTHGGDGVYYEDGNTYNPFIDHDPYSGLDFDILDAWEVSFNLADENNIITLFNFFDDETRPFGKNRDVITNVERSYIVQLVKRYRHHKNWIWMIAEEFSEIISRSKAIEISRLIKEHDPYHPIAIHQTDGIDFQFKNTPINVFLVQYNDADADELYDALSQAVDEAAGRYAIVLYENTQPGMDVYGYGEMARKKDQAIADAGAHVMRYDHGENRFSAQDLINLKTLQIRMENMLNAN